MSQEKTEEYNSIVLERISYYLNLNSDFINANIIKELEEACNLNEEEAFSILLAEICGFDIENNEEHREIYEKYFPYMIHKLNINEYKENPYYKNIKIPYIQNCKWRFKEEHYKPYEAFVYNDLKRYSGGRIIPQIGFFSSEFNYPAVLENNREWMLITPNEIETMKEPIKEARGKVLTFGLGLGYYVYMVSEKEEVSSITVVEKDKEIINMFEKYILPQFKNKEKIKVIQDDAFRYAEKFMKDEKYDFVFTDIWHDPSDGIELYLKMKEYERFNTKSKYMYWIEETILFYLK